MPELIEPTLAHSEKFLAAVALSTSLHRPWVKPPCTQLEYERYLEKLSKPNELGYLVTERDILLGVINVNEIVMGSFCSGYLGFYSFLPHAGQGHMKTALAGVIALCFETLGFNRLEANVQPKNLSSLGMLKSLGFRKEGFSEKYLKIGEEWKDHERWAMLKVNWSRNDDA